MVRALPSVFLMLTLCTMIYSCDDDHTCQRQRKLTSIEALPDSMKGDFIMDSTNYVIKHCMESPMMYALGSKKFIRKGRTDNPIYWSVPVTGLWSFTEGIRSGFLLKTTPVENPEPEFWELSKVAKVSSNGKENVAWIFSSYKDSLTCNHYLMGSFRKREPATEGKE